MTDLWSIVPLRRLSSVWPLQERFSEGGSAASYAVSHRDSAEIARTHGILLIPSGAVRGSENHPICFSIWNACLD